MNYLKYLLVLLVLSTFSLYANSDKEIVHIELFSIGDIHGKVFSNGYTDTNNIRPSMENISLMIKEKREKYGDNSVFLIGLGDVLQGDISMCYYNSLVSSSNSLHIISDVINYLNYDALLIGNHDIEASYKVYNRIAESINIPYLAANMYNKSSGKPYFDEYQISYKNGIKIATIGMTNPNTEDWLLPSKIKNIEFKYIYPVADSLLKMIKAIENPDITILAIHEGTETFLEMAHNLKGIDIVCTSHDHKPYVNNYYCENDSILIINSGANCENLANVSIDLVKENGKIVDKKIKGQLLKVVPDNIDEEYREYFTDYYNLVREYATKPIGSIDFTVDYEDGFSEGSSLYLYLSLINSAMLSTTNADISFAAPLKKRGVIEAGRITNENVFELYQYENDAVVINMTGAEVKNYMEEVYEECIKDDYYYYNYDVVGGMIYNVYKNKPYGERVEIFSFGDGAPFDLCTTYKVATTSYRISGGGYLLSSLGISKKELLDTREVQIFDQVRHLLKLYISELPQNAIKKKILLNDKKLGKWNFVE